MATASFIRFGCRVSCAGALVAVAVLAPGARAQQTGSVAGVVMDQATRRPLSSAQVFIERSGIGGLSNTQGRFLLTNVPVGQATLNAQLIGYASATRVVTVTAGATVDVTFGLEQQALGLDEIIVTGTAGGTQKRAIGNSVARLDMGKLAEHTAPTDMGQLLNARAPGVILENANGAVGQSAMITIRGISTLSLADQPLLYIDGIRADNRRNTGLKGGQQGVGISRFNDINPADIESIEIIKGPAASTLYGAEASNGVIQIITKRGREGRGEVGLSVRQGARWLHDPAARWPVTMQRINGQVVVLNMIQRQADEGTPYFRNGRIQGYGASFRGGAQAIQYYLSGDYDNEEGVQWEEGSHRSAFRGNLTSVLNPKLSLDGSYGLTLNHVSFSPVPQPEGDIPSQCTAQRPQCIIPQAVYLNNTDQWQDAKRTMGSVKFDFRPASWLAQRFTAGVDLTDELNVNLNEFADSLGQVYLSTAGKQGSRTEQRVNNTTTTLDFSSTATWHPTSSLGSTSAVGVQYVNNKASFTRANGTAFAARGLTTISTAGSTTAAGDFSENTSIGVFVQEQVGWNDRLFLTGALRADDNSSFGDQFDVVLFPKLSASWVVSDEPFWHLDFVNALKLRAAYGSSGQAPNRFSALRTYTPTATGSGAVAFIPGGIGNPDLGPERGQETELGFETSLLGQRMTIDFTYYHQLTRDAILARQVAPSQGYAGARFTNAGKIENTGIELLVGGQVASWRDARLDLNLNVSHNHNEILDLGGVPRITVDGWIQHVVGYPVGSYFMPNPIRARLQNGVAVDILCDGGPEQNHKPVDCAGAPRVFIGAVNPPTEASFSSTLSIGNRTELHALVDTKRGGVRENVQYRANCSNRSACREALFPEEFDPVRIARVQKYPDFATYAIEDATFTRFREVGMSYVLPESWLEGFGLKRGSVAMAVRNLRLWTHYTGWDPETFASFSERGESSTSIRRENRGQLPLPMSFQVNFNLTY